jgi:methionine aminotransferase
MSESTIPIQSKLPQTKTSIFSVMSGLAAKEQALNLSQGFPNFKTSETLIGLVNKAMQSGLNQYAPMPGIFSLRDIIAQKTFDLYQTSYNPDTEITITAGATQAIFTVIAAFINKGDEVIIFTPAYDCYEPSIELFGGITHSVALKAPDYKPDWEQVKSLVSSKTKMIIINTPHNPTGSILQKSDLLALQNIVKDTDIIVLSDEVYEHIIFDGEVHQSVALFPELVSRSFIVASFGKTFHHTGWKTGYVLAPDYLMAEFRKVHQFNVFCVNHPIQVALAEFLKTKDNYLSLPEFYQRKRDYFLDLIKESRFEFTPAKGTYFQLLNYKNISDENDYDFAVRLTKESKIASIPISVFYNDLYDAKMLRFCFAKTEDTLAKAAEILCKI